MEAGGTGEFMALAMDPVGLLFWYGCSRGYGVWIRARARLLVRMRLCTGEYFGKYLGLISIKR